MRIVIDARILRTTTGRYVERLLHYLQQIDVENEYVVLLSKKDYDTWEPSSQRFCKMLADFEVFDRRAMLKFGSFIKKLKPDLVHFAFQSIPPNYFGPYIVTIHDLTQLRFKNKGKTKTNAGYAFKQKQLELLIKLAIRNAKCVIAPTEFVRQDLLKLSSLKYKNKVFVTYEGAESSLGTNHTTPLRISEQNANIDYILYVGTAHAHKNLQGLLEAFQLLSVSNPHLQLFLAGKQDDVYKKFLASLSPAQLKNVKILGFVSDEELVWLYKHARAYVFPSLSEGFGLPGLEAMQFGCPVISSNATCLPEVYGDAAHYFDPSSPEEMAKAIKTVLDDTALRESLIKNGHEQVKKYSWQKMAEQTLDIYKKANQK